MIRRKTRAKSRRKVRTQKNRISKAWLRVKRFTRKNVVALISLVLSILTSLVIYYLAYSEPDIRAIRSSFNMSVSSPVQDKSKDCVYYNLDKLSFKNLSFKSGFIDKVNFVPLTDDLISEFKLIDVDKSSLTWGEEREIEVRYYLILTPDTCAQMAERKQAIDWEIRFYDNTGKLITKYVDGDSFQALARFRTKD